MRRNLIKVLLISICLAACTPTGTPTSTITATDTHQPTLTHTSEPTTTYTLTPTQTPTATPEPQVLGRVFPEQFHGQAVWSNAGGNSSRNFNDRGWFCPPDGSSTSCNDAVIHFDVSHPTGFGREDTILSPIDGIVTDIYDPGGNEGKAIIIKPESGIAGIEELLKNEERLATLSKDIFTFNYSIEDVTDEYVQIAHLSPLVNINDSVYRGEPIATIYFDQPHPEKKIGYVVIIYMNDGSAWQFGPCNIPNEDEFCGKCAPGTHEICP